MAMIQRIRKNTWLLFGVIILALAAFIIMDATGQGTGGGATSMTVASVEGEDIDFRQVQNAERILYTNSDVDVYQRRNFIYNYFVGKKIIEKEVDGLGLGVGEDELQDLQFGASPSTVIQQRFSDPNTGMVDRERLSSIQQAVQAGQLQPELAEYWTYQQQEIVKNEKEEKLINLVRQGIYTPNWMVEEFDNDQNNRTDFTFVRIPLDEVPMDAVSVSDAEIKDYLAEHESEFIRANETRQLEYISYEVQPTSRDTMLIRDRVSDMIENFKTTDNDTLFVQNNYGSFDLAFVKKANLLSEHVDSLWSLDIGEIYGPYLEEGQYKAAKMINRKIIPDSVKVRHILRSGQTVVELNEAKVLLDSIKLQLENGTATWDSLARAYSQDPGSANNGGEYDYAAEGTYVKNFNDMAFYLGEPGEINLVVTEFGLHLLEVMDQKFITNEEGVQVAYLDEPIVPSEYTQDSVYDLALDYLLEFSDLESIRDDIAKSGDLQLRTTAEFEENDFSEPALGAGETTREMIRWAFDNSADIGDVSPDIFTFQHPELYFNERYVIAGLSKIYTAGKVNLANVRDQIEGEILNRKRGEYLANEIGQPSSLAALAAEKGVSIDTARGVNFVADFIANLGEESQVAVVASMTESGDPLQPIVGNQGVYYIEPLNKIPPTPTDLSTLRTTASSRMKNQTRAGILSSLREMYSIKDSRSKFY